MFAASSKQNGRLESFLNVCKTCRRFDCDISASLCIVFIALWHPIPGLVTQDRGFTFSAMLVSVLGCGIGGSLGHACIRGVFSATPQSAKSFTFNCLPPFIPSAIVSLCWGDCGAWVHYGCERQWLGHVQPQHVFSCCSQP